jgi:chromosome segregation ATPase
MKPKVKKISVILLLVFGLGGVTYLINTDIKLSQTKHHLEQTLERTEKTNTLLKRKYAEEKAKADAMRRAKLFAEGQKREAEQKVESLTSQLANFERTKQKELKQWQDKLSSANGDIERLKGAIEKWRQSFNERTEILKQTLAKLKKSEGKVERQSEELAELKSDLEREKSTNERYLKENKKMAEISQSILAKYDDKGVFESLKQVEPFTQLKQVELEKVIQQYLDELDGTVIRNNE